MSSIASGHLEVGDGGQEGPEEAGLVRRGEAFNLHADAGFTPERGLACAEFRRRLPGPIDPNWCRVALVHVVNQVLHKRLTSSDPALSSLIKPEVELNTPGGTFG